MASALKTVPCRLPDRSLWFGKAKLLEDEIVVTGWEWTGHFERRLSLEKIESAQWFPREEYNLLLRLHDGSRRVMDLKRGAGLWYWKLKDLIGDPPAHSAPLPSNGEAATGSPREQD